MNACTVRSPFLICTHSPCRGDFSSVALAQSWAVAAVAIANMTEAKRAVCLLSIWTPPGEKQTTKHTLRQSSGQATVTRRRQHHLCCRTHHLADGEKPKALAFVSANELVGRGNRLAAVSAHCDVAAVMHQDDFAAANLAHDARDDRC